MGFQNLNNKASIRDLFIIFAVLFGLGTGFLILVKVMDIFTNKISNTALVEQPYTNETFTAVNNLVQTKTDYIFLAIFFGFVLAIIITGYFASAHPVFMIFYILGLILLGIVGGIFSYVWDRFSQTSELISYLNNIPITNFILQNFVLFTVVIGFMGLVVMYIGYNSYSPYQ